MQYVYAKGTHTYETHTDIETHAYTQLFIKFTHENTQLYIVWFSYSCKFSLISLENTAFPMLNSDIVSLACVNVRTKDPEDAM